MFERSSQLLPPANEVCEGCVFTPVCHSVHGVGVSASVHVGCTPPSRADTPWSRLPLAADIPPVQCMLGDTGNKRAVRILLECILVLVVYLNSFMQQWIKKLSSRRPRSKKFTQPLLAAIFLVIYFYRISEDGPFEPLLNQLLLLRLFLKKVGDISPFYETADTPVLDFW